MDRIDRLLNKAQLGALTFSEKKELKQLHATKMRALATTNYGVNNYPDKPIFKISRV